MPSSVLYTIHLGALEIINNKNKIKSFRQKPKGIIETDINVINILIFIF